MLFIICSLHPSNSVSFCEVRDGVRITACIELLLIRDYLVGYCGDRTAQVLVWSPLSRRENGCWQPCRRQPRAHTQWWRGDFWAHTAITGLVTWTQFCVKALEMPEHCTNCSSVSEALYVVSCNSQQHSIGHAVEAQ